MREENVVLSLNYDNKDQSKIADHFVDWSTFCHLSLKSLEISHNNLQNTRKEK